MIGVTAESTPLRDVTEVAGYARRCFRPAADRVGVELEFLVFDRTDPGRHVPMERTREALPARLPGGSRVTFEPGGQLELSGPAGALPDTVARLTADVAAVRDGLRAAGLALGGVGLDPVRPPCRQLGSPRYEAMAEFLGAPYGPLMMCSTASIQVNLDFGRQPGVRWERAHALGPVLLAAFANSPLSGGRPYGWMSGRQDVWNNLDPSRTRPVPVTGDPVADWTEYLLDSRLMLIREDEEHYRPVRDGSTFRDWLEGGSRAARPTLEDLTYHATTVFPPVRPRGWLEIRYLDAQHPETWAVCVAVTHALITDDRAADVAMAAVESRRTALPQEGRAAPYQKGGAAPYREEWDRAARCGLADPRLRSAAEACFRAALEALPRLGADAALAGAVAAFADRHVSTGRSPAADLVDPAPRHPAPAWLDATPDHHRPDDHAPDSRAADKHAADGRASDDHASDDHAADDHAQQGHA
ncbi:ergothioneine biosynthesis glutamate--cysteine ligase EgtA [Nonomuraea gerenzanensis]|uniref:Glutamate--cysteine ligase EgtA n=1 Tax=Nonomuraea gerenzanensis TaxID=93944 RepID=A0A1M4E573_9ACTN|nr:ergothioneine biosynthesis glutamate--cysteine ligase EgtA [Nonomuraea gerenzanensis]UBU16133.1 ergothioneine biosynthesis glutamate--cysteine ligase EgtA [Nonomuraea gerenzanensis]SBO93940.1 glutamate-cysteine ligase precursor [Nonomuraea gerenzanensis]